MKEKNIDEIENVLDEDIEVLKINIDLLLKAFDCLNEDVRKKEFSKMAVAASIVKSIIDDVRKLGEEKFNEVLMKDEFVAETFHRLGTYMSLGVDLGYAIKINPEEKKDEKCDIAS